jgi:hypothetical protein
MFLTEEWPLDSILLGFQAIYAPQVRRREFRRKNMPRMFQNLIPLTTCDTKSANGAGSPRRLLESRSAEPRVEIEASAARSPSR